MTDPATDPALAAEPSGHATDLPSPAHAPARGGLVRRSFPIVALVAVLAAAWATGLTDYLSLDSLKANRERLVAFTDVHPWQSLMAYIAVYIVVVVFSIPGALIMTLTGGMLFGTWLGGAAAVVSAATGATIVFLVGRSTFGEALRRRAGAVIGRLIAGFEQNAASYLLTLRLIPGVPFFAINLAAGIVRMPLLTYVLITIIGIMPGSLIYASIGAGLVSVFARGEEPNLSVIFEPQVLGPLLGLASLSLLSIAYRSWRVRRAKVVA